MPSSFPNVVSATETASEQVILATASYDHDIKLWQAHTTVCKRTLQHPESQVNSLEITPDRQSLAAGGYQHIRMYDLNSAAQNPTISFENISKNITAVGFHEDSKWMYTGGEDGTAKIWDRRASNLHVSRIFKVDTPINTVCLHPNQTNLFIGDQAGFVHIWDVNCKRSENDPLIPEPGASIQCLAVDPNAMFLAAINNKGNVYVWRLAKGMENGDPPFKIIPKLSFQAHTKYGLKVKFSPDSSIMATTSADGTANVWRTSDFSRMKELKTKNQRWVWDLAFTADSQYIITGSSDSTARLWCVATGKVVKEYSGHRRCISAIAFRDCPIY